MTHPSTQNWQGACVVEERLPTWSRPLHRLRSYKFSHAYLDAPLVDRHQPMAVCRTLFEALSTCNLGHGIRFQAIPQTGPLMAALQQAAIQTGVTLSYEAKWERACCHRVDLQIDPLASYSKTRRKSLRRAWRHLESIGPIKFRLHTPTSQADPIVDQFLQLEDSGWKREQRTSLLSHPHEAQFFRDTIDQYARQRRIILSALQAGDKTVAVTCNLRAADTLFALKVGWDSHLAAGSPGLWSEVLLPAALFQSHPELKQIDSCSKIGSHLEHVWPDRRPLANVVCTWSRRALLLSKLRERLREFKRATWPNTSAPTASSDSNNLLDEEPMPVAT